MRFKAFLKEGQYKENTPVKREQLPELLTTKYSDAYDRIVTFGGDPIFRGDREERTFFIKSPRPRTSAYTSNFYTLIVDNSESWAKWRGPDGPTRSNGIICTNDIDYTNGYGNAFIVLPENGAKIIVASEEDFWDSFPNVVGRLGLKQQQHGLSFFNSAIHNCARYIAEMPLDPKPSLEEFKKVLNVIGEKIHAYNDVISVPRLFERCHYFYEYIHDNYERFNGDVFAMFDEIFDPKKNEFKIMKHNKLPNYPGGREMYVSCDCLMIFTLNQDLDEMAPYLEELKDGKQS